MADDIAAEVGQGEVRLIADRAYPAAYTLRIGGTDQSYVDLDDPRRLEFDYVQRLADAIELHPRSGERLRIVHVGGAAMTLARYVAAVRARTAQIVLEPDPELTDFVRTHLPLPRQSGIKVRAVDGLAGIAEMRDDFADIVVVDAFAGARVPAELGTAAFFADVARVLTGSGTMMINLTDHGPFGYARRVIAGVRSVFDHLVLSAEPATLKGRRFGNVLILGSKAPLPVDELAQHAGRSAYPYRVVHGDRLDQMLGGAVPFTPDDAEQSPAPPAGMTHFG